MHGLKLLRSLFHRASKNLADILVRWWKWDAFPVYRHIIDVLNYIFIFLGPLQELGDIYEKIATAKRFRQSTSVATESPALT